MKNLEQHTHNNINNLVCNFYSKCDISDMNAQADLVCNIADELLDNMEHSDLTECPYTLKTILDIKTKEMFVYFAAYSDVE